MGSVRTIAAKCLPVNGEAVPPSHTLALIGSKEDKAEGMRLEEGGFGPWESSLAMGTGSTGGAEGSSHKREQAPEATLVRKTSRCRGEQVASF